MATLNQIYPHIINNWEYRKTFFNNQKNIELLNKEKESSMTILLKFIAVEYYTGRDLGGRYQLNTEIPTERTFFEHELTPKEKFIIEEWTMPEEPEHFRVMTNTTKHLHEKKIVDQHFFDKQTTKYPSLTKKEIMNSIDVGKHIFVMSNDNKGLFKVNPKNNSTQFRGTGTTPNVGDRYPKTSRSVSFSRSYGDANLYGNTMIETKKTGYTKAKRMAINTFGFEEVIHVNPNYVVQNVTYINDPSEPFYEVKIEEKFSILDKSRIVLDKHAPRSTKISTIMLPITFINAAGNYKRNKKLERQGKVSVGTTNYELANDVNPFLKNYRNNLERFENQMRGIREFNSLGLAMVQDTIDLVNMILDGYGTFQAFVSNTEILLKPNQRNVIDDRISVQKITR